MSGKKDNIYQHANASTGSFRFDAKVADVFADMIERSVPGYNQILGLLPSLVRHSVAAGVRGCYYDLGCSLGAGMMAIAQGLENSDRAEIIGIDNSASMIDAANTKLAALDTHYDVNFSFITQNINQVQLDSAAMILMNFTLQFLPIEQRTELIQRCYDALNIGGQLVVSEKIQFKDAQVSQALTDIHHQFKEDQGYSRLEISQKRDAIENVLIPETLEVHTQRLKEAGFSVVVPWIQNLQFISILSIK